jgi:hypothetical protein
MRCLWFCLIALGLAACDSTGVGNPGTVSLAVVADDTPAPDAGAGSEPMLLDAIVVVEAIRLVHCDGGAATMMGPFAVNLVTGEVNPDRPRPVPAGGEYCGLEAPLGEAVRPASIAGRSVFFHGRRTDGTEFYLFASVEGTLRVRARSGKMTVPAGGASWLWGLRPRRWTSRDEIDTLPTVMQGDRNVVLINADRHPALFDAIRRRLGGLSALYDDANGNGLLDDDERTDENVIGDGSSDVDP